MQQSIHLLLTLTLPLDIKVLALSDLSINSTNDAASVLAQPLSGRHPDIHYHQKAFLGRVHSPTGTVQPLILEGPWYSSPDVLVFDHILQINNRYEKGGMKSTG